jgi:hypothetical protein
LYATPLYKHPAIGYDVVMTKNKTKKFKVGDIIKSKVQLYSDKFEYDEYLNERKVVSRDIQNKEETLLIVGHDGDKRFIVAPLGENIYFSNRTYFSYGGFDKCFKLLVNYVNDNCTSISTQGK